MPCPGFCPQRVYLACIFARCAPFPETPENSFLLPGCTHLATTHTPPRRFRPPPPSSDIRRVPCMLSQPANLRQTHGIVPPTHS